MRAKVKALLAVCVALFVLYFLIRTLVSVEFASLLITVLGVMATVLFPELRAALELDTPSGTAVGSTHWASLRSLFAHADLSVYMLGAIVLAGTSLRVLNSIFSDLTAAQAMTFPSSGFTKDHLSAYTALAVVGPQLFLIVCIHSYVRGFRGMSPKLTQLLLAVALGVLLAILALNTTTPSSVLQAVAESATLRIDGPLKEWRSVAVYTVVAALFLATVFVLTTAALASAKFGEFSAKLLQRTP